MKNESFYNKIYFHKKWFLYVKYWWNIVVGINVVMFYIVLKFNQYTISLTFKGNSSIVIIQSFVHFKIDKCFIYYPKWYFSKCLTLCVTFNLVIKYNRKDWKWKNETFTIITIRHFWFNSFTKFYFVAHWM